MSRAHTFGASDLYRRDYLHAVGVFIVIIKSRPCAHVARVQYIPSMPSAYTLAGVSHTVKDAGTCRHLVCLLKSR